MGNYYFVAPSLPPLVLGQKPDTTFEEVVNRLQINLSKEDWEKVIVLRRFIDLTNIRSVLLEQPVDARGNLNEKELDEALSIRNILPDYVFEYLDHYDNVPDQIRNFAGILTRYFSEEISKADAFLRDYLEFERNWRLVMMALRSKELNRDVVRELQFEEFSDPIVAQILAQKDAPQYDPPEEFRDLKDVLTACGSDPWERYKAFAHWRFQRIEEMVKEPLFSMDWILGYLARLMIVEDWNALDDTRGRLILDNFKTG